ncbi:MAG: FKBP-type peptidyl-prolyl cis-trans isomerase [Candidatus Synoicihabitans palmerolidicus]|nr:FKBP-type peptidyl-prolyl cis-trans isomerase [Candidatus Synoicihabitans palmerolidicus]
MMAHYTGTLDDGTVFDTSRDGGQPFAFTVGKRQVIKGWDEGFRLLQVGDHATLVIPPELAYGDKESDTIPANSRLHFEVELVGLKTPALADILKDRIDAAGVDAGRELYAEQKAGGFADAFVSEGQMNGLGYHYLFADNTEAALAVLQWNVEQFPESGNVYDSLGEAWVKAGDREAALANYRRSLELDPTNTNAEQFIAALQDATPGVDGVELMQEKMALKAELSRAWGEQGNADDTKIAELQAKVDAFLAKPIDDRTAAEIVRVMTYHLESTNLAAGVAWWRTLEASKHEAVRAMVADKLRFAQELEAPLELTYTAIDGRVVDLAKMRGKVVLVGFWAMWCGPCIAELPNLKKVYAAYHDQSFEIVGISMDNPGDLGRLKEFVMREEMPWPQQFAGKRSARHGHTLARRFAVTSIPTMLLVDRDGMIVTMNSRGEKLEQDVRRLLKIDDVEPKTGEFAD